MKMMQKYLPLCLVVILSLAAAAYGQQLASVTLSGQDDYRLNIPNAANSRVAGSFHTDADLAFKDFSLPKGDYTLYILADSARWQLALNKATGPDVGHPLRPQAKSGPRADADDQASHARSRLQIDTGEDRAASGRVAGGVQRQGSLCNLVFDRGANDAEW